MVSADRETQVQLYAFWGCLPLPPIEYHHRRNINYYVHLVSFGKRFYNVLNISGSRPAYITLVILYYDHASTLQMEIERFWNRGPYTWPTFFFFLNRYLAFLGHFPVIIESFWTSTDIQHKSTVCMTSWFQDISTPNWFYGSCSSGRLNCYLTTLAYVDYFSCSHVRSYHQYLEIAIQVIVNSKLSQTLLY